MNINSNWLLVVVVLIAILWANNMTEGFSSMYPILNEDASYPSIIDSQTFYKYDIGRFQRDRPCMKDAVHQCPKIWHNYPVDPSIYRSGPLDGCSAQEPQVYKKLPSPPQVSEDKVPRVKNSCPQPNAYVGIREDDGRCPREIPRINNVCGTC